MGTYKPDFMDMSDRPDNPHGIKTKIVQDGDIMATSHINNIQSDLCNLDVKVHELETKFSRIVFNTDPFYCEQVINQMSDVEIQAFMENLHKLKLLSEKILLDRS